ncbi:MAG: ABC transporter permease, partial [Pseudomonadota bacterium]
MATAGDYLDASALEARRKERRERFYQFLNKAAGTLGAFGFGFLVPLIKLAAGDSPKQQLRDLWQMLVIPLIGIVIFLMAWAYLAPQVKTSLGAIPGPSQVWEQAKNLYADHLAEREKEERFYERLEARNAKLIASGRADRVKHRTYTGKPTYFDQIITSLGTVALGFLIATVIAVPLGIMCGLSQTINGALNPLIQIFKPVSPLAWLPIVTMVVSAVYLNPSDALPKSLVISAITVTLCSLWPTLINTALGVSSID